MVRFLIITFNFHILYSSWDVESVFVLVYPKAGSVGTWFWMIGLGGGGKANTPGWAIYGAILGGKLENKDIIVLGCIFSKDTKVCLEVLAIW